MQSLEVSAPGKLMLLGEHAVVYGRACLVTAVGQRLQARLQRIPENVLRIDAPDVGVEGYEKDLDALMRGDVPKGARFMECAVRNVLDGRSMEGGVHIATSSEFSSLFGFGSSSAAAACAVAGICRLFAIALSPFEQFQIAYQTVLDVQGKGSGFDIAAALYGGTLHYARAGEVLEPVPADTFSLVIGYTGVKADTVQIVEEVQERMQREPARIESIYDRMAALVAEGREALIAGDARTFGRCMNDDQELLENLGVSSAVLDRLIGAARDAGALGAKLSGAGKGDCMIALADPAQRENIAAAIAAAGGQVMDVSCNVSGLFSTAT